MGNINSFKAKISEGNPIFGIVLRSFDPAFAELAGLAGFDFAWIDMEHSPLGLKDVQTLIIALENRGCIPLVRVPRNEANVIGGVLDLGAKIVDVPNIKEALEAKKVVQSAKYFPMGRRGFSSSSRSNRQGIEVLDKEEMERKNKENMVMVQIESKKGMQNLAQIAQIEGIDAVFLGLGDMSQDLGIPGQFKHPDIAECVKQFVRIVTDAGKISGIPASDPDMIGHYIDLGYRIFFCGIDVVLMKNALISLNEEIRSRVK